MELMYVLRPDRFLSDQYPNIIVISTIHIVGNHKDTIIPFVLVCLETLSIFLDKSKVLGFLKENRY